MNRTPPPSLPPDPPPPPPSYPGKGAKASGGVAWPGLNAAVSSKLSAGTTQSRAEPATSRLGRCLTREQREGHGRRHGRAAVPTGEVLSVLSGNTVPRAWGARAQGNSLVLGTWRPSERL